jgi:hypothetical protein
MTKPVLIISFARKENVLSLVHESIKSGSKRIYISVDGTEDSQIQAVQSELRAKLFSIQNTFPGEIIIWQRKMNLGPGASVIASLDWVFSREEEVQILEDDLVISSEFFKFMNFGFTAMKMDNNLKIISGTNPFEEVTNGKHGMVNYPVSWGWATNQRNWSELRNLIFEGSGAKTSLKDIKKLLYWDIGRTRSLLGQIEAWDIPLASEMYKTSFYALMPPYNLVRNIGFDEFASHTSKSMWPLDLQIKNFPNSSQTILESGSLIDLNLHFETDIFRIRPHHLVSWVVHKMTDRFRFKKRKVTLFHRIQLESFPRI